jgi:uncharacterized membrane protein
VKPNPLLSLLHWISGDSLRRFAVSLVAATLAYVSLPAGLGIATRAIAVWDGFATGAIVLAWLAIVITPQADLRKHARAQDLSRLLIFVVVVTAACAALLSVAFVMRTHQVGLRTSVASHVIIGLSTVGLCWILLHTLYSLHYAHVYYGDSDDDRTMDKGLAFPDEKAPDYLDFAYFSFVIGMTCQVSDVQITSRRMRRLALLHGVISFGFNTFILALLINTISGLL